MIDDQALEDGIDRILTKHLNLSTSEEATIIFDETGLETAVAFERHARLSGHRITCIFVPMNAQHLFTLHSKFTAPMMAAINDSGVLITLLDGSSLGALFRSKIVSLLHQDRSIAHTPSLTLNMLGTYFKKTPEEFDHYCIPLAYALNIGTTLKLKTWQKSGKPHTLTMELGQWDRLPIISNGGIPRGSWGNLIPAETYISPLERSAHGSVVITGSLPGRIVQGELILAFDNGHLISKSSKSRSRRLLEHFFQTTEKVAFEKGDNFWTNLAEIGFGANNDIPSLTGIPVVDEKKFGTVHIALGSSTDMGGEVDSAIHYDMVISDCIVEVFNPISSKWFEIVNHGKICVEMSNWVDSLDNINLSGNEFDDYRIIYDGASNYKIDDKGISKTVTNAAMKKLTFHLGDQELAKISIKLLNLLNTKDTLHLDWDSLSEELNCSVEEIQKTMKFLHTHRIVNLGTHLT